MIQDFIRLYLDARLRGWKLALAEVMQPDVSCFWQLLKYLVIGGLSVVVFMFSCSLFRILAIHGLGASYTEKRIWWNLLEIGIGFIPTNAFTYATNRRWVFVAGRHDPRKEFFLFTAAAFLSLVVAECSAYAFMTHTPIGDFMVKLAVIAICTLVNFTFRKMVVFSR
ncbi:MAG: GtrA family protein [Akkermansiaceae bacterium]